MNDCLFCKICSREIPSTIIYEDGLSMAFADINPRTAHHYLLIPKTHVATLNDAQNEPALLGALLVRVPIIAKQLRFYDYGYSVRIHCNQGGGQEVYHLHLHILSDYAK